MRMIYLYILFKINFIEVNFFINDDYSNLQAWIVHESIFLD